VAFSPDNRWLASGGKDNVIKIWDLTTGNVLRTLYGHSSNINVLTVSEDGELLASGSGNVKDDRDFGIFNKGGLVGGEDNTVRIWNVQTGAALHVLRGHELPVGGVALSHDGRLLTSVSGDAVKMWDVAAGTELGSQKTKYQKSGGEKLGSLSIFGSSKQEKQQQQRFKNFRLSASKIVVSANGQAAAIGQPDKAIKIYDAQSGSAVRELSFKASPQAENSSLAFSADATLVAFAKTSESVCVQETVTGRERYCQENNYLVGPATSRWSRRRAAADEPALRNLKATEPEDAVFIYFAGHGTAQGQRFYLIPHDLGYTGERTKLDDVGLRTILEHSISDEELERAVEGIDADKLLMVIDACNSGQALEAEERRRGPMNSKGLAQLAHEKGMYILTAAQSYQAAQEVSQLGHGLLTYALVEEGLKQGAADSDPQDRQIVVREWFDYATTRVPNMQLEKLKVARDLGLGLSFVEPDTNPISAAPSAKRLVTQTPRAFYRRESEDRPLIVARR
jgi:hypothetical protein